MLDDYLPEPEVITVYDVDGREHYTSRTSPATVKGLERGTLFLERPEKPEPDTTEGSTDVPPTGSTGDDQKPGVRGSRSGHKATDPAAATGNA